MSFFRRDEPREEELAALADGSLPEARREAVEALAAGSPELQARLDEQHRAVALVRGAAHDVEAPAGLRDRIEAQRRQRARARRRPLLLGAGVATAAVFALAIVLLLPSGVGGPSLAQAATLATRPPTAAAPRPLASNPKLLSRAEEGVPFPAWLAKFGWRATGARVDTLDGREATTVFYDKKGKRIAYTIVGGDHIPVPERADEARREGVELHALTLDGREVVTWLRRGHTCVLSGAGVDRDVLLKLAAWTGKGSVPF
jgi:hypothetical protein